MHGTYNVKYIHSCVWGLFNNLL
jgi:hypothetical protein